MDLNHTTLTDLQQRLQAVEGSVGQVKVDLGKVQTGFVGVKQDIANIGLPNNLKILSLGNASTLLNVTGKGKLYCVGARTTGSSADSNLNSMTINIDGKNICTLYRQHKMSSCYICSKIIATPLQMAGAYESISSHEMFLSAVGVISTPNISAKYDSAVLDTNSTPESDTSKRIFYQSVEPLIFEKSLKITNSNSSGFDKFIIAYALD